MMKFEIGDRVEIIGTDEPSIRDLVGSLGTVVVVPRYDDDLYLVAIDGDDEYEFLDEEMELE
jgi:hypothetical protein